MTMNLHLFFLGYLWILEPRYCFVLRDLWFFVVFWLLIDLVIQSSNHLSAHKQLDDEVDKKPNNDEKPKISQNKAIAWLKDPKISKEKWKRAVNTLGLTENTLKRFRDSKEPSKYKKQQKGSGICFNFQREGYCRFGDKCKYKHETNDSESASTANRIIIGVPYHIRLSMFSKQRNDSETLKHVKFFVTRVLALFRKDPDEKAFLVFLRSDDGEMASSAVQRRLAEAGIVSEFTCPYTPE